jgi:NDP-sugar pyrophosphorylase family protein
MGGVVCVGRGTRIKAGAFIEDSIIWDEAVIEAEGILQGCVVGDRTQVTGEHRGEVLIPG